MNLESFKQPLNYFEALQLPQTYEQDIQKLESQYEALAVEVHPDFYATESEELQKLSQYASSLLNQSYQTLKDPSLRAAYLLSLEAKDLSLNERTLPEGFLQKMFFLQESLDEYLEAPESHASELQEMKADLESQCQTIQQHYAQAFSELEDSPNHQTETFQSIQTHLNQERYLQRLLERLK